MLEVVVKNMESVWWGIYESEIKRTIHILHTLYDMVLDIHFNENPEYVRVVNVQCALEFALVIEGIQAAPSLKTIEYGRCTRHD